MAASSPVMHHPVRVRRDGTPPTRVAEGQGGHLGSGEAVDRAVSTFAESYADRNEEDHHHFKESARVGRIVARTEQ